MNAHKPKRTVKNLKAIHHRGTEVTEVFLVKRACGVINNIKGFSSVSSVPLW